MTYLNELEQALVGLPKNEQENIIEYYRNYLADGGLSDEEARVKLGEPAALAEKLKADFDQEDGDEVTTRAKQTQPLTRGQFILVILTSPIWLLVTLISFLGIASLPLLAWGIALSLIIVSAFSGIAGAVVLTQNFWGGLFYIGMAVISIGLSIMFSPCATWLVMKATDWTKALLLKIQHTARRVMNHE